MTEESNEDYRRLLRDEMSRLLEPLSEPDRMIVQLAYGLHEEGHEPMGTDQIAARLGLAVTEIEQRLEATMTRLRRKNEN